MHRIRHNGHSHSSVQEVKDCDTPVTNPVVAITNSVMGLTAGCEGGKCSDIYTLCSRHQQQYQGLYGRASNE